jgi:hypothetical protein
MPATRCNFIKPDGAPCAAHPLPNSDFCLFHDPDHRHALTESRSKGGAAPRRRLRRFPRLLDHMHVAELLGELFIDSLNDPAAIDTHRLQALTALSRVLLKAVGTPPTFLVHSDRREPSPAAGHLLRIYPPSTPEVEALLAAEPPTDPGIQQPPPPTGSPVQELDTIDAGDGDAWNAAAEFLPPKEPLAPRSAPPPFARPQMIDITATLEELARVGLAPGRAAAMDASASAAAPPQGLPEGQQAAEQVTNRRRTGPSPTDMCCSRLFGALLPPSPTGETTPEVRESTADHPAPDAVPPTPAAATDVAAASRHPNTRTPEHPTAEQGLNRSGTGCPGTNRSQLFTVCVNGLQRACTPGSMAQHPG